MVLVDPPPRRQVGMPSREGVAPATKSCGDIMEVLESMITEESKSQREYQDLEYKIGSLVLPRTIVSDASVSIRGIKGDEGRHERTLKNILSLLKTHCPVTRE